MVILKLSILIAIIIIIMLAHSRPQRAEPLLYIVMTPPLRFHLIIITVVRCAADSANADS